MSGQISLDFRVLECSYARLLLGSLTEIVLELLHSSVGILQVKLIDSLVSQMKFAKTATAELAWVDGQVCDLSYVKAKSLLVIASIQIAHQILLFGRTIVSSLHVV